MVWLNKSVLNKRFKKKWLTLPDNRINTYICFTIFLKTYWLLKMHKYGPRPYDAKQNKLIHRETNMVWFHFHVEFKKQNKESKTKKTKREHFHRERKLLVTRERRGWWAGKICEGGREVETSHYKINKSWGCDGHHGEYSQWYCNNIVCDRC